MTFPNPIPLPKTVFEARRARRKAVTKVINIGIAIRLGIVAVELIGFWLFSSHSLLLDSIATLADCISSVILLVSIALASRPPDENHPFGHGRYEPVAGLQLGIFLALAGIGMFVQQFFALIHEEHVVQVDNHAWLFALFAVILLELCYFQIKRIAVREKSAALLAEAFHFRADSINTIFALFALILAAIFPQTGFLADRVGALVIALFMCIVGCVAAKKNLNQLLDHTPDPELFVTVREAALLVTGVRDTEKIRIQQYGPDAHVDIDVEVDPLLSVEEAHTISQEVRFRIQIALPSVQDVIVHIEPYYPDDHH
jgi:cation diffusion facilitator family transporter